MATKDGYDELKSAGLGVSSPLRSDFFYNLWSLTRLFPFCAGQMNHISRIPTFVEISFLRNLGVRLSRAPKSDPFGENMRIRCHVFVGIAAKLHPEDVHDVRQPVAVRRPFANRDGIDDLIRRLSADAYLKPTM
jgi:hypothetical protein